jgi:hypothetical protein
MEGETRRAPERAHRHAAPAAPERRVCGYARSETTARPSLIDAREVGVTAGVSEAAGVAHRGAHGVPRACGKPAPPCRQRAIFSGAERNARGVGSGGGDEGEDSAGTRVDTGAEYELGLGVAKVHFLAK